jgi:hypothetical protein
MCRLLVSGFRECAGGGTTVCMLGCPCPAGADPPSLVKDMIPSSLLPKLQRMVGLMLTAEYAPAQEGYLSSRSRAIQQVKGAGKEGRGVCAERGMGLTLWQCQRPDVMSCLCVSEVASRKVRTSTGGIPQLKEQGHAAGRHRGSVRFDTGEVCVWWWWGGTDEGGGC